MENDKFTTDGGNANSGYGSGNPTPKVEPATQPTQGNSGNTIDEQVKNLTEKLDRTLSQYDGSTKEALRLKKENDELKASIEAMKKSGSIDETKFQKLIEEKGLVGALDQVFGSKVSSLEKRVEQLIEEKSQKIYDDFVATHTALKDTGVVAKFEAELSKLKGVYDIVEAMEKAYVLAGGREAETKTAPPTTPKVDDNAAKAVVSNVIGGEADSRPAPVTQKEDPAKTISDLRGKAASLELQGKLRQAAEVYAKIEELKAAARG